MLFRPHSYRKCAEIDCYKSLWRRSTVLSNSWTQKSNIWCMWKIPSVLLQQLIVRMPSRNFEVINANGGSTKYQIKNVNLEVNEPILMKLSNQTLFTFRSVLIVFEEGRGRVPYDHECLIHPERKLNRHRQARPETLRKNYIEIARTTSCLFSV